MAKANPLTRQQLAAALGCSTRKVDRLIQAGLEPVGIAEPSQAKLYRLSAARRLARRLAGPARDVAAAILIADYTSHAQDLADRQRKLVETWIPDASWHPAWERLVALLGRVTASWPHLIHDRLRALSLDAVRAVAVSDVAVPSRAAPSAEACALAATFLKEQLSRDPWPRPEAQLLAGGAVQGLSPWYIRRTALELGITTEGGLCARPTPGGQPWFDPAVHAALEQLDRAQAELDRPGLLRPLLESLAEQIGASRELTALGRALAVPPPARPPANPRTADAARGLWRQARAQYRQQRTAMRRAHQRRAAVHRAIDEACTRFRQVWWESWSLILRTIGDGKPLLPVLRELQEDALRECARCGGLITAREKP